MWRSDYKLVAVSFAPMMNGVRSGKSRVKITAPATVGIIASRTELRRAKRLRLLPDLFELRLDCLPRLEPQEIAQLRRPLIITARHFSEGGHQIGTKRAALLLRFLPYAMFVDVELRSLGALAHIWEKARQLGIGRICSVHDFRRTPPLSSLMRQQHRAAKAHADIFKLVTRADSADALITLLKFVRPNHTCVMAIGRLGPLSRIVFPALGSVLIYATLGQPMYEGQLTWPELRRLRDFYAKK